MYILSHKPAGIKNASRSVSDLELALLHLQEDIEIPEINLIIHPVVKQLIAKATEESRKPSVQDLGDKYESGDIYIYTVYTMYVLHIKTQIHFPFRFYPSVPEWRILNC